MRLCACRSLLASYRLVQTASADQTLGLAGKRRCQPGPHRLRSELESRGSILDGHQAASSTVAAERTAAPDQQRLVALDLNFCSAPLLQGVPPIPGSASHEASLGHTRRSRSRNSVGETWHEQTRRSIDSSWLSWMNSEVCTEEIRDRNEMS